MQGFAKKISPLVNTGFNKALHSLPQVEQGILQELIDARIIDSQQLEIVSNECKKGLHDLPSILVSLGFIKHSKMKEILHKYYNVEEVNLESYPHDMDLIKTVNKNIMLKQHFVPFMIHDDIVSVAISNPKDTKAINTIKISFSNKYKIRLFYAQADDITHFISSAYIIAENRLQNAISALQNNVNADEPIGAVKLEDNIVVNFVSALLEDATLRNASDIHIEPQASFIRVRYRIDGKLMNMIHIYKQFWGAIVVRIKVISNMNIAETRMPQDGRIALTVSGKEVDFRISCQPGIYGEKFVIRVLDKSKSLMTLEQLGFSQWNFDRIQTTIARPSGITIVTGPTGSGKTTTLYSMLSYLNNVDTNIMTLEDPVEYTVPLVFQTQVRDNSKFDFAAGVRSAMRQDPDILLVGEIRDHATAEAAVRASLTGHKVLTTLHAVDSATTIQRLVDIGIDRYMISGNLDTIISQRLVRKLCPACKKPHTDFSENEAKILQKYQYLVSSQPTIYRAEGCKDCNHTGYRGRTTIAEILHISPEIDDAILNSATKHAIITIAKQQGFRTIQDDAFLHIVAGKTSLDEISHTVALL